jgi:predicted hydrocarbon binding protein
VSQVKELSGLYYPNKIARIFLGAMEDVMGKNGLNAILNLAGLQQYIDNYPPDNLERQFDFAHFTALQVALEDMYGPRGGRGLALRAGRACFAQGLKNFGALAGAGDLAFKVLPLSAKLKMGLPAMAAIFTNFSDQLSVVEEHDDHYTYIIKKCPLCWGRKTDKPVGHTAVGLLQEGLRWVSGGHEFRVVETECKAKGDEFGVFVIYKEPIG